MFSWFSTPTWQYRSADGWSVDHAHIWSRWSTPASRPSDLQDQGPADSNATIFLPNPLNANPPAAGQYQEGPCKSCTVFGHDFCRLGVLCSLRKVYFAVSDWFYHLMMTQSQCKIWAESETKSNFNFRALRQIGVLEFQQLVIVFVSIVNVGAYPVVMNDLNLNDLKGMLSQFSQFPRRICSLCPHCQSLAYGRKLLAATNTLWITVLCLAARSVTLELQDGLEPVRKLCPRAWDIGAIVRCPKVRLSLPFSTNLKRPMLSQSPEEDESFCLNPKKHRFFVPNLVLDYRSNLSSSPQCALSQTKLKCLSVCHAAAKAFS